MSSRPDSHRRDPGVRRLVLLVYALLFLSMTVDAVLPPLLHDLSTRYSLSTVAAGLLLAMPWLAMFVCAFPSGMLTDRFGPPPIALAASFVIAASCFAQAAASGFWTLLGGRALFGVGFGLAWTAGIAWLSELPVSRASTVGGTTVAAALGTIVGPALGGSLAGWYGVRAPFLVVGCAGVLLTGLLLPHRRVAVLNRQGSPLPAAVRAMRSSLREQWVLAAVVLVLLSGVGTRSVLLLVPLHLGSNGLSAASIGWIISVGSLIFLLVSAATARIGDLAVTPRNAAFGLVVAGIVFLLPIASLATVPLVVFMYLRWITAAPLATITYPLAVNGAERAALQQGAVIGLVNGVWSLSSSLGPIIVAALAQWVGTRGAFASVCVGFVTAGLALLLSQARAPEGEPVQPNEAEDGVGRPATGRNRRRGREHTRA
jgi:MFS family permease